MLIYLSNQEKIAIHDAVDAYNVMLKVLERDDKPDLSKEHLWVIALSIRNLIVNIELVSVGSAYFTSVDPKEIMSFPSQKKAASIIMIHNHPFGEMEPSEYDLDATDRMIQVGRILDIHVIDHLIISERKYHGYYSFADYRVMDRLRKSIKYIPSFELKEQFEKKFDYVQKQFQKELKLTKKQSKEKGILIGQEKGKIEGEKEKALSIAKAMLKDGFQIDKVMLFTGLSKSDIQDIR